MTDFKNTMTNYNSDLPKLSLDELLKRSKELTPLPFMAVTFSPKYYESFIKDEWIKVNADREFSQFGIEYQIFPKQEADYIIWHNEDFYELYCKMADSSFVTAEMLKDFITKKEDKEPIKENPDDEFSNLYEIPERPIRVILSCTKEYINEADVKFLGISENMQGQDVLTFECPKCGETHESLRLG